MAKDKKEMTEWENPTQQEMLDRMSASEIDDFAEYYYINPASELGLKLASQAAMKRITDHLDMRVREWESKKEIKQVFKRFDEAGIMLYNPLANQPRAIDQRTAMQNMHPTIDHDKLRALQNTRRFVNP